MAHKGEEEVHTGFRLGPTTERDHLEDLEINGLY